MRYSSIGTWLQRCIDPLGLRTTGAPQFTLSPLQTRNLLRKAEAHHVLSTVVRNIPFPAQHPAFDQIRQKADATRIAALALSAMLKPARRSAFSTKPRSPRHRRQGPDFCA